MRRFRIDTTSGFCRCLAPTAAVGLPSWRASMAVRPKCFLLAEFEEPIPELRRPIVPLVDYVNHKIERPTIEESAIESARKNRSA